MMNYKTEKQTIRRYAIALALALLMLGSMNTSLLAASQSSARSVAMGGAFTSLAAGVEAHRYNPANLGFDGNQKRSLEIIGLGADLSNNSFSLDDYNNFTGAFLTQEDKDYLMDQIPDEGLAISADIEASALSVSFGSFAFSLSGVGQADISLGKDIVDLMLNGNTFGDTIDLAGTHSDAVGYVSAGVSYGLPIYTLGTRQLTVGATAKYIRGLGMEEVVEIEGLVATYETGFAGEGHVVARSATGGSGYALDLGAALQLSDSYLVGVRMKNILSSISWNSGTEEHGYMFSFDTMTIDNSDGAHVLSEDYSQDIASFSTGLPTVMNLGVANTSGQLVWAIDWEQGFRRAAGASRKPRLAGGLEYTGLLRWLPLRTGFATGGNKTTAFSMGFGLVLKGVYIDAAAVTGKSLSPSSNNGINMSLSTGFFF